MTIRPYQQTLFIYRPYDGNDVGALFRRKHFDFMVAQNEIQQP